jgi:hypothetical protein
MPNGIQRIAGITGLNPISEHELFRDHNPLKEVGGFAHDFAKGAVQERKQMQAEAMMMARSEGLTFDEAFAKIKALKKERAIESGYTGLFGIACLVFAIPLIVMTSIFDED